MIPASIFLKFQINHNVGNRRRSNHTKRKKISIHFFLWICPQVWRGHLDGGNQKPLILVAAFGGSTTVRRSVKMSIIVWPALSFWFLSWFAFDYNQKLFGATATEWESSDLAPVFHEITGIMAIIASSSSSQKLGKVWARTDGWSGEWKTTISSILTPQQNTKSRLKD